MIFLYIVIWKQAFRIRFLDISKTVFLRSNPLRKVNFFLHGYDIFFSRFLFLSTYKNFWKYQTVLSKKSNVSQQPKVPVRWYHVTEKNVLLYS